MAIPQITVTLFGIPATCSVQAAGKSYAITGVLDDGQQCHIYAGHHPLPMACVVRVYADHQQWTGYLTNERVWEDGTLSYTLERL